MDLVEVNGIKQQLDSLGERIAAKRAELGQLEQRAANAKALCDKLEPIVKGLQEQRETLMAQVDVGQRRLDEINRTLAEARRRFA